MALLKNWCTLISFSCLFQFQCAKKINSHWSNHQIPCYSPLWGLCRAENSLEVPGLEGAEPGYATRPTTLRADILQTKDSTQ